MDTGSKILEYLRQRGITQTFLATHAGIGLSKLNLALNGKRRLTIAEYEVICWVLGVGPETFLQPGPPEERNPQVLPSIKADLAGHNRDFYPGAAS